MPQRNFPSRRQPLKRLSAAASLVMGIAMILSGCAGGADRTQARQNPARIQGIKLDADDRGSLLRILADREFRATVQAKEDPPEFEIEVPFAVAPKDMKTLIEEVRLPRGGIRGIRTEDLPGKLGGVRFFVLTDGVFSHSSEQTGKEFLLHLEKRPTLAAASDRVQAPDQPGEKKAPAKKEEPSKRNEPQYLVPQVPTSQERDYAIGGRDILRIVVFEEPDMSKDEMRVSNDGYITFPLIGRVRVEGLTANELEKEMVRRLGKDFLVNPQVTVQVKEFASKTINVLGAVKSPGALPLKGPITLLETLARAGGVSVEEAGRSIVVLRPVAGEEGKGKNVKHMTINLNLLLKGGDLSKNIFLQDKDTVFVPQADQIFVFGEVKSPGPYKLRERTISVVEAITMAGGPTRLGATNRTRIVRVEGGEERVINVNVEDITKGDKSKDIVLQSGDIVVVPETYF